MIGNTDGDDCKRLNLFNLRIEDVLLIICGVTLSDRVARCRSSRVSDLFSASNGEMVDLAYAAFYHRKF